MAQSSRLDRIAADNGTAGGRADSARAYSEVLDFPALCDRCMGNLGLVQRVLDKFEERLPEELAELERVFELEDAAKIALVAHRIKGNSCNVSATGLRQAAAEIEDLSRSGRVGDIHSHLDNLREQWQRYIDCRATIRPAAPAAAVGCRGADFQCLVDAGERS